MNPQAFYTHDAPDHYSSQYYHQYNQRDYGSPESTSLPTPTTPYHEQRCIYAPQAIEARDYHGSSLPSVPYTGYYALHQPDISPISPTTPRQLFPHGDNKSSPGARHHTDIEHPYEVATHDPMASLNPPPAQIGERIDEYGIADTLAFDAFNKLRGPRVTSPTSLNDRRMEVLGRERLDGESSGEGSSHTSEGPTCRSTPEQQQQDATSRSPFDGTRHAHYHHAPSHAFGLPRALSPSRERRQSHPNPMASAPQWGMFALEGPQRHPHPTITIPNGPPYPSRQLHANTHSYPYPSPTYLGPPPPPSHSPPHPNPHPDPRPPSPEHALTETHSIPNDELDRFFTPADGESGLSGRVVSGRKSWKCPECKRNVRKQDRASHKLGHEGKKRYDCRCGKKFGRPQDADRHLREQAPCQRCGGKMGRYGKEGHCSTCVLEIEQGGGVTR